MDWDTPLVLTRSLTFEISGDGKLIAGAALSRGVRELPFDALPILAKFAPGATPQSVYSDLRDTWEVSREAFEKAVQGLLARSLLLPFRAGRAAVPAYLEGSFSNSPTLPGHHAMLADAVRVMTYQAAIRRACQGKVVLEVGAGSGILSIFAAQAGARRVIAVEQLEIAELAEEMFRANRCDHVVELFRGNSRDLELDEPVDVILHEIFGSDPFVENLLPALGDAQERFLRPGGQLLPHRLEVFCLGLEIRRGPQRDKTLAQAEARQLASMYGVNFEPYLQRLDAAPPELFPDAYGAGAEDVFFPHSALSDELLLLDLDLTDPTSYIALEPRIQSLQICHRGTLEGIILYFRTHLDDINVLSTSPFAPLTSWGRKVLPLQRAIRVEPGDSVPLAIEMVSRRGRQELSVDLAPPA